jgi:peptide deformylase
MTTLKIVPVDEIPVADDVPLDNLFKVYDICMQLQELCLKEGGIGIAAVQAGIPWKLFIIKTPFDFETKESFGFFVNCDFEPQDEVKLLHIEGCLSLRTSKGKLRSFEVERYCNVKINGFRLVKTENDLELVPLTEYLVSDFSAAVFQHEIQHHQGILISDIGTEVEINRIL